MLSNLKFDTFYGEIEDLLSNRERPLSSSKKQILEEFTDLSLRSQNIPVSKSALFVVLVAIMVIIEFIMWKQLTLFIMVFAAVCLQQCYSYWRKRQTLSILNNFLSGSICPIVEEMSTSEFFQVDDPDSVHFKGTTRNREASEGRERDKENISENLAHNASTSHQSTNSDSFGRTDSVTPPSTMAPPMIPSVQSLYDNIRELKAILSSDAEAFGENSLSPETIQYLEKCYSALPQMVEAKHPLTE